MSLWGKQDRAEDAPIFAPALVRETPNIANRDALYHNTTPDASGTVSSVVATKKGWVLKRTHANGRVTIETIVGIGSIALASNPTFWYALYGDIPQVNDNASGGMAYDADGNIYMWGEDGINALFIFLVKYSPQGDVIWQKSISSEGGNNFIAPNIISISPRGHHIYLVVSSRVESQSCQTVIKIDANGNFVWKRSLSISGGIIIRDSIADDQGNLYLSGSTYTPGGNGGVDLSWPTICKIDQTGNLTYARRLDDADIIGSTLTFNGCVEQNGNLFTISAGDSNANDNYRSMSHHVIKYDVNGDIVWQNYIDNNISVDNVQAIVADSVGNIYVAGTSFSGGQNTVISKYDVDGNITWQKQVAGLKYNNTYDMEIDANDDLYVTGEMGDDQDPAHTEWVIGKYDGNGNAIWQRRFGTPTGETHHWYWSSRRELAVKGDVYAITGYSMQDGESVDKVLTAQLPVDGSKTGTYGLFEYVEVTIPEVDLNYTTIATNFTLADVTLTVSDTLVDISMADLSSNDYASVKVDIV